MINLEKNKKYVLAAIVLVIAAICAFILIGGAATGDAPGIVSAEKTAENSLHEFFGDSDRTVEFAGIEETPYADYYKFTSEDGGEYYVDAATYTVSRASFPVDWAGTNEVRISLEEAEEIARTFVSEKRGVSDIDGLDAAEAGLLDHGSYKEYQFIFREIKDGVILLNMVLVHVNPSNGDIFYYGSVEKELEVSLVPEISEEEAIEIAISQFGEINVTNTEARLIVNYTPDEGSQRLLWDIMIEGKPENHIMRGGSVVIDAITGEVYSKRMMIRKAVRISIKRPLITGLNP